MRLSTSLGLAAGAVVAIAFAVPFAVVGAINSLTPSARVLKLGPMPAMSSDFKQFVDRQNKDDKFASANVADEPVEEGELHRQELSALYRPPSYGKLP